jgi:hypothetical protein
MMPWLKLDDNFITNPKLLSVQATYKALYFWMCGYSAKELTDGVIERPLLPIIAAMCGVSDWQDGVNALVAARLLEVDGENYRIHDYLEYNPTRDQVLQDRAEAKERMQKLRSQDVRANTTRTKPEVRVRLVDPVPVPDPVPNPRTRTKNEDSDDANASLPPEIKQDLDSCLRLFGAKRFKTPAQRTAYIEIHNKHGPELFRRAVTWGAQSGMGLGDVKRMASAANTMALNGDKQREGNNGAIRRPAQVSSDADDAAYERFKQFD